MTSEELLNREIYCPEVIDLRIIAYLKLGFKVLLKHYGGISVEIASYVLLTYQSDFFSDINFSNIIGPNNLCTYSLIQQIQKVQLYDITNQINEYYFINSRVVFPIYIGYNQISDLENYINTIKY